MSAWLVFRMWMEPGQLITQSDNTADNDERGRLRLFAFGDSGKCRQRSGKNTLVWCCSLLYQGNRGSVRHTVFNKFGTQCIQAMQTHIHDDGLSRARKLFPVEVHRAIFKMSCHEYTRLCMVTMR